MDITDVELQTLLKTEDGEDLHDFVNQVSGSIHPNHPVAVIGVDSDHNYLIRSGNSHDELIDDIEFDPKLREYSHFIFRIISPKESPDGDYLVIPDPLYSQNQSQEQLKKDLLAAMIVLSQCSKNIQQH